MPVVHVRAAAPDQQVVERLVCTLPAEVEARCQLRPGGVWCTFQALTAQHIGGALVTGQGVAFVDVLLRPRAEGTEAVLQACAEVVARELSIPLEDVWAVARELEPGRVFAGGALLRW